MLYELETKCRHEKADQITNAGYRKAQQRKSASEENYEVYSDD